MKKTERIKELEAEIIHLKLTAKELADNFDARAETYRDGVKGAGIDTNSRLAASHRGRARSYNEAADRVRSRFKIAQTEGVKDA